MTRLILLLSALLLWAAPVQAATLLSVTTGSVSVSGSLSINASGLFVVNGTQTFLLGVSYFDGQNYRTSDIDTLAARGFNLIRVFANWAPDLYGAARSVCDANGALVAARRDQMQNLIAYAKTKNIVVILITLDDGSDIFMTDDTTRLTCVTNQVNFYKTNWNVIYDVVQEHDIATSWGHTATKIKTYTDAAKAACPTCVIYASATNVAGFLGPSDSTSALSSIAQSNISQKIVTNGESVLAIHDYRSTNWFSVSGVRAAAYRTYLNSIGKTSTPVVFDEPSRVGDATNPTESEFLTAASTFKAAGGAMWVFHSAASFNMAGTSMFGQFDAIEAATTLSLANALGPPARQLRFQRHAQ